MRCTLTNDELLTSGKRAADLQIELAQIESDKKRITDDFKAKASAVEAELTSLASKISTGYEHRIVTCTVKLDDPEPGKKTIFRDDTFEAIGVEDMTNSEMQRELPME